MRSYAQSRGDLQSLCLTGPHDKHMTEKLDQMDVALSTTLDVMDTSNKCHLALIFGDHGMTEDG